MPLSLNEEKELLRLKGEILRLKFGTQTKSARQEISQPIHHLSLIGSTLAQPIIRSLLLNLLSHRLFTVRNLLLSGLGVALIGLLGKEPPQDR
ncbi:MULTISPECIES: hypothetical protein [Pasteurellaceae]|uniref:hypothetical protein n=1 Tax=Pasteurellaceae TaxID=712 RepID=UPI003569A7A5